MATDFTMYAGDTRVLTIGITDEDGAAVDVSTAQAIRFGVFGGGVEQFVKDLDEGITVEDSVVTVTLEPADTQNLSGSYVHELEIVDVNGHVYTALQGHMRVLKSYLAPAP
jgi:hypothetical protein